MNSNPRFYPKHLAKKYVQQWNEKVVPEVQAPVAGAAEAENSVNSQQVGPPALSVVTNINGFRFDFSIKLTDSLYSDFES